MARKEKEEEGLHWLGDGRIIPIPGVTPPTSSDMYEMVCSTAMTYNPNGLGHLPSQPYYQYTPPGMRNEPRCQYCGRLNKDHREVCNGCGAPL